jgi:hypothetical protein
MTKLFLALVLPLAFVASKGMAQATDSVFVTRNIKHVLYTSLPAGIMLNSKGSEVDYVKFIKNERRFKDKPTFFITWSNRFCPPCIRLIDSLLNTNIQNRYNVVLVNRDQSKDAKEPIDDIALMKKNSEARPAYGNKAISLFDHKNVLKRVDEGAAPMMFWMDKEMNIAGSFLSYGITIKQVEAILEKVDAKTITVSKTKVHNENWMPVVVGAAAYKQTINEVNGIYTFTLENISTKEILYRLNFSKTPEGFFTYHKSSMSVPRVEDLYSETEIVAAVKKMLLNLNTTGVDALKSSKVQDYVYQSKITIKNFNTYIQDNETAVIFRNIMAQPALDRSSSSKKLEFHFIANALGKALSIKPKEDKGEYSGYLTYTYTVNKAVKMILKESDNEIYFNLVAKKEADGTMPTADKTQLTTLYNASKLCEAVKRIQTELGKSNKSGIIGNKTSDGYISKIQVENFKGNITESNKGYLYFEYTGYVTAQPFEGDSYEREFELISAQLQNCLNIKPQKDRSFGSTDNFMTANSRVEVGMNSKKTNMWIRVIVMKKDG